MYCATWVFMMCGCGIMKSEAGSQKSELRHLARIEVGPSELPRLLESGNSARVAEALKEIGYAHVTLDLQGYRRGSLNETKGSRPASEAVGLGVGSKV